MQRRSRRTELDVSRDNAALAGRNGDTHHIKGKGPARSRPFAPRCSAARAMNGHAAVAKSIVGRDSRRCREGIGPFAIRNRRLCSANEFEAGITGVPVTRNVAGPRGNSRVAARNVSSRARIPVDREANVLGDTGESPHPKAKRPSRVGAILPPRRECVPALRESDLRLRESRLRAEPITSPRPRTASAHSKIAHARRRTELRPAPPRLRDELSPRSPRENLPVAPPTTAKTRRR